MRRTCCVIAWIAACGSPPDGAPTATAAPDDLDQGRAAPSPPADPPDAPDEPVTPWPSGDDDDVPVVASLDEVELLVTHAVASFGAMSPWVVADAWERTFALPSATCPQFLPHVFASRGQHYWRGNCRTDADTWFLGYHWGIVHRDWTDRATVYPLYIYLYGDFAIEDADGGGLALNGLYYLRLFEIRGGKATSARLVMDGTLGPSSAAIGGSWMTGAVSVSGLSVDATYDRVTGARTLALDGGVTSYDATGSGAWFDHLFAYAADASACSLEPGGAIQVRDARGEWYTVTFDGPTHAAGETVPSWCDGCGRVEHRGEALGEVCPDLRSLFDWVEFPW